MGSGQQSKHRDGGVDADLAGNPGRESYRRAKAEGEHVDVAGDRATWPGLNEIVEQVSRAGATNGGDPMAAVVSDYLRGPWARQFQADVARELAAREERPLHVAPPQPSPAELAREPPALVR